MAACSFRPASSVPGGSGMLVFSTSRPIVSVGGTTHACPGLAVASAATTTQPRSGNGRGLAVLGIAVPQAVWGLLPAGSRGMVALAVPEGASGWGVLHSGDLPASIDDIKEPGEDKEMLLLQTGASSVAAPEIWRLLPPEGDRGVVNLTVPATTADEDGLDAHKADDKQQVNSHSMAACSSARMLVFSTSRSIVSACGNVLPCQGLAVSSAATTTPPRSGNGRGLAVLGIAVPQAVWSLLPAGSRGMVALAVPEGASGWGMLHSGDLPASSDDFTVPATTTEVEGLLSPTSAVGSYSTIPVGTFSGVRGFLFSAGNCFGVRDEGKRGAAALAMPKHASSGWGFNTRPAKLDLLRCRCTSDDGQYDQEFLAKLAEVRRQASLMHVIVGDTNTNEEVDNATRTCTGVLIDVVMAADLGREEWKMKMQDAVDLTVVFEDLSAEVRAGVVINRSLKNGIRCIRKLADLVAHEAVLPAPWYADELEEFARMVNKELYFRALMDEFSQLAEVVKSVVAVKLAEKP